MSYCAVLGETNISSRFRGSVNNAQHLQHMLTLQQILQGSGINEAIVLKYRGKFMFMKPSMKLSHKMWKWCHREPYILDFKANRPEYLSKKSMWIYFWRSECLCVWINGNNVIQERLSADIACFFAFRLHFWYRWVNREGIRLCQWRIYHSSFAKSAPCDCDHR